MIPPPKERTAQNQFSEGMELLVTKINQVRLADEATLTGCGYMICDKMIIYVNGEDS